MEVYRRSSGLLLLLGFVLLATALQGVQGEVESEGPSESECRPYIEKALKELEAGEGVVGSSEAADDSKEDIPTVEITDDSEHQDGEGDDNDSNENGQDSKESKESTQETVSETKSEPVVPRQTMFQKITNRISQFFQRTPVNKTTEAAIEEKSTDKEADESQEQQDEASAEDNNKSDETETKDDSKEDDKDAQEDSVEATADEDSKEGDDKEDDDDDDEETATEGEQEDDSKEDQQAESKEESGEAQDQVDESEEAAEQSKGESEEGPAESKEEETAQEQVESVEDETQAPDDDDSKEQAESKEEADDGDSKEAGDGGSKEDAEHADSKEEAGDGDSKEDADNDDSKEAADADDDSKEDAKQESKEEPEQADSKEESVEKPGDEQDDTQEDDGSSKEQADQDSKEEQVESREDKDDSKEETADDDQTGDSAEAPKAESEEEKQESADDEKKDSGEDKDDTDEDKTDSKEDTDDKDDASKENEKSGEDREKREAGDEPDDDDSREKVDESEEEKKLVHDDDDDDDDSEESTRSTEGDAGPVEELSGDIEIPSELRSREHVEHLLKLDEESSETESVINRVKEVTLKELKKLYENAIKPLETLYKYRDLSNRHFGDSEIFSKPLILFMGPWSGGKSSIINYLVNIEYNETALRTGAEPSPAYFNILMYGDEPEVLDGTELAADFTFSGLQKFGQGLEERLRGLKVPSKLLEKVNVVEIPGILEVRKQVSRVFPFNDACQWFIDRADIIFLVYDPSKLDVGPETEAILDQLKGREHQTRIVLNKADQVKPEELMRVQGALIWNISPLMSSPQPPVMYTTSLWSKPFEPWAPTKLLQAQERAFLRDLRGAIDKRIENKIASARRFAVRVRNHAKMVDCYLTTYYNHKSVFGNRKQVADEIIDHPQDYHIYEGLSTLTNISRYDLPDPDVYRDFFKLNPLYEFQQLSATCTYFRGCPINRLDIAIAYDLPELVGTYKKLIENALTGAANQSPSTPGS